MGDTTDAPSPIHEPQEKTLPGGVPRGYPKSGEQKAASESVTATLTAQTIEVEVGAELKTLPTIPQGKLHRPGTAPIEVRIGGIPFECRSLAYTSDTLELDLIYFKLTVPLGQGGQEKRHG
jgi:hypothetical protein